MVTIYQFQQYDITTNTWRVSRRWGTREAIEALGPEFQILETTAADAGEADIRSDIPGLTQIGFTPHCHKGAQRQMH